MAYAAVVSLEQTIVKMLDNGPYSISVVERDQMISIRECLISLETFLEDFPDKATDLEIQIRDIANAAEDAFESFMWQQIQLQLPHTAEDSHQTSYIFDEELKKAMDAISYVTKEVTDFNNRIRVTEEQEKPCGDSSTATSLPTVGFHRKTKMISFMDDLFEIKDRVFGESSKLQVIPIVGMGGIGKTTLARNVYNDSWIIEDFKIRVWVTVSQDYRKEEVLMQFLHYMNVPSEEIAYKTLKGRRYFIVMDDMWNTKAWDDLRRLLPDDHNGSRIILTTRILDVATYVTNNPPHEMHLMDEHQSWNLLQQLVFRGESCPPYLENDGRMIARNCRGLPLALVVMAGVLSTISKTQTSWKNVTKDVIQAVMANDDQFATTLVSLSYNHLPQHLRPCFLYMGCFPEDFEISASILIKLWVGEGFLKPSGSMSMEEWAEECLNDLVRRNLVLVNRKKSNGKIKTCGLHDLVRDSCTKKAHEEMFLLHIDGAYMTGNRAHLKSMKAIRRLLVSSSVLHFSETEYGLAIRSILCFEDNKSVIAALPKLKLVRVLDTVNIWRELFLDEVIELFHLRYLAFSCFQPVSGPLKIPSAISNLMHLQTLIINPRRKGAVGLSVHLPHEFWDMIQLRHLISYRFTFFPDPEGATSILTNLETLFMAKNFVCSERVLKMIPNVKKLGLCYRQTKYDQDYQLGNLISLHQLEILELDMDHSLHLRDKLNPTFPISLKKLTLACWIQPWSDMAIIGSLPNLETLKLVNVNRFSYPDGTWETNEGEFLRLKFLLLDDTNLKHWVTESSHFPCLQSLLIYRCTWLREIPEIIGEIPTLELLEVDDMNELVVQSAKQIQEEQQDNGNDALRVCIKKFSWFDDALEEVSEGEGGME